MGSLKPEAREWGQREVAKLKGRPQKQLLVEGAHDTGLGHRSGLAGGRFLSAAEEITGVEREPGATLALDRTWRLTLWTHEACPPLSQGTWAEMPRGRHAHPGLAVHVGLL